MTTITITYRSSDGAVARRRVSDWRPDGEDAIDAYCSLRMDRRTFKLASILAATDDETGELISNPWRLFGLDRAPDGTERLISVLADRLIAIKVLKLYAKTTRGFSKRERDRILDFIQQSGPIEPYSRAEIEVWLVEVWAGDAHAYRAGEDAEYRDLLRALPKSQVAAVRVTAELIARGSGRSTIAPGAIARIARDFESAP